MQPDRPRKSIGAEDTFADDIFELEPAKVELVALAGKVWRFCKERSVSGRTVTLKVKYADVQIITRSKTVQLPIRSENELRGLAAGLMEATFPTPKGIRLLGVTLSSLVNDFDGEELQLSLSL